MRALLFLILITFSSCSGQGDKVSIDWKTVTSNNQRTGHINTTVMINKPEIKVKKEGLYSPVVKDGIAYFLENPRKLYAFDIEKEVDLWTSDIDFDVNDLAIDDNDILYLGGFSNVAAIDVISQEKNWQIERKIGPMSGITINNGIVYVGGNSLIAYDAKNGNELWRFKPLDSHPYLGIPAVLDDVIYIGGNKSFFYALDAKTGKEIWKIDKGIIGHPSSDAGKIFISGFDGFFYALDAQTGQEIWRFKLKDLGAAPITAKGKVYVSASEAGNVSTLYAIEIETGNEIWHRELKGTASNLVLANDQLILGLTIASIEIKFIGILCAIDAETGNNIWTMETNSSINPGIVVLNNAILYTGTVLPSIERMNFNDAQDFFYIVK